jgi:hypothetical protein
MARVGPPSSVVAISPRVNPFAMQMPPSPHAALFWAGGQYGWLTKESVPQTAHDRSPELLAGPLEAPLLAIPLLLAELAPVQGGWSQHVAATHVPASHAWPTSASGHSAKGLCCASARPAAPSPRAPQKAYTTRCFMAGRSPEQMGSPRDKHTLGRARMATTTVDFAPMAAYGHDESHRRPRRADRAVAQSGKPRVRPADLTSQECCVSAPRALRTGIPAPLRSPTSSPSTTRH